MLSHKELVKEAERLRSQGIAFFTCYIWEEWINNQPKKNFGYEMGKNGFKWKELKSGEWTNEKIKKDHNAIVVITGNVSGELIGIDWDLFDYNIQSHE